MLRVLCQTYDCPTYVPSYHAVALSASIHLSGMVDVPLIVVKLRRAPGSATGPPYLLVTDDKGRITHVTGQLAERLGTTASKMQSNQAVHAMDVLLPEPFTKLHRWVRDAPGMNFSLHPHPMFPCLHSRHCMRCEPYIADVMWASFLCLCACAGSDTQGGRTDSGLGLSLGTQCASGRPFR